jgi:hypothetical protein
MMGKLVLAAGLRTRTFAATAPPRCAVNRTAPRTVGRGTMESTVLMSKPAPTPTMVGSGNPMRAGGLHHLR